LERILGWIAEAVEVNAGRPHFEGLVFAGALDEFSHD
jgi:hypothetical protein